MTRRRGDRFIQLTELLHHVAEAADSESTHEAMAAKVTRSTDWLVEAEDVRDLLRGRLIPAGLVAPPGGGSHVSPVARDASPLRMNGRTRVLGLDGVDKIAKVFGMLFVPGVFHEFGHAALRYGGRAREMGFGLYLVYPALYTDTTDSYRLGRWARVRTDLGGFYFHLIFGVSLMYLSLLTGWEWLLVGVLLINPGYGVPVHAVHALRRLLGVRGPDEHTGLLLADGSVPEERAAPTKITGTRLPNLKPWVKGVFATYVVVTVPVLALLLFNLITRLPDIIRIA